METALRIVLLVTVVGLALWLPKYFQDHPVEQDINRLESELQEIVRANDAIRGENERYRNLVRGLREDPRIMDRRARQTLGMSRQDEIVIWFVPPADSEMPAR